MAQRIDQVLKEGVEGGFSEQTRGMTHKADRLADGHVMGRTAPSGSPVYEPLGVKRTTHIIDTTATYIAELMGESIMN